MVLPRAKSANFDGSSRMQGKAIYRLNLLCGHARIANAYKTRDFCSAMVHAILSASTSPWKSLRFVAGAEATKKGLSTSCAMRGQNDKHRREVSREGFPPPADNIPMTRGAGPLMSGASGSERAAIERAVRDAVLRGDVAAWRAWYAEHFDRLAAYANWRCGGIADLADDVVQEAWITAVRRLRSFDPAKGPFFAWLCGIASNAARNAIRGWRRHRTRFRPLESTDDPPATASSVSDDAERVAAALAELPEHYEEVLRAKYFDQLSVEAIAQARGESAKATESLLTRARQAFREAFEKAAHE